MRFCVQCWGQTPLEVMQVDLSRIWANCDVERYTQEESMIKYARLMIEMSLEGPFPECIEFFNDNEVVVRQQIKYEWLPLKCNHCHMFGHEEGVCKKKGVIRKE